MANSPVIVMSGVCKEFSGTTALKDISIQASKGEVVGLVGENGAGKSTLMKILCGVYPPTSGELQVNGKPVAFRNTNEARQAGISMIYQELSVFPDLNAVENIFINNEIAGQGQNLLHKLSKKEMRAKAADLMNNEIGVRINLDVPVRKLRLADRQMVEIARSVYLDAAVIIMDEPTEPLEISEQEQLFRIIGNLKASGHCILYISHQLDQLKAVSDRIYVLKDGRMAGEVQAAEVSVNDLIEMMIGGKAGEQYPSKNDVFAEEALRVEGLGKKGCYSDISFSVRKGEILGLSGLSGSGKSEIIRSLYGDIRPEEGNVYKDGKKLTIRNPVDAMALKFGFIGADRKAEGLFLDQNVEWNVTIADLSRYEGAFLKKDKARKDTRRAIEELNIKTPSMDVQIGNLSGGNQQKALVARWLLNDPDVILVEEPTRGIDVRAKTEIYRMLIACCKRGKAVVVVSSEIKELLGLCNRILAMHNGKIVAEFNADSATEAEISHYIVQETESVNNG